MNERQAAFLIIHSVMEEGSFLNKKTEEIFSSAENLSDKEKNFIRRLSAGTVEKGLYLDTIINTYSKTPVKKMKPKIKTILRMGVYQLKFMDSVPDSAAVNESVKLAVKNGQGALKGFVNGVLRSISRNEKEVKFDTLSKRYSVPEWITRLFEKERGKEGTEKILRGLSEEKKTCIFVNGNKTTKDELKKELTEQGIIVNETEDPDSLFIENYGDIKTIPGFGEGKFYIQDLSTILAVKSIGIKPGDRVLDVCAAPGGKTIVAAVLTGETGRVTSCDISKEKVDIIKENIKRCGMENVDAVVRDATKYIEEDKEKFDVVICDLPCSGLGIMKRKPDIRYRVKREDITALADLQKEMLGVSKEYVRSGGKLLFSTCTLSKEEDEKNKEFFLEDNKDYKLLSEELTFPDEVRDGFYHAVFCKG